MDAAWHKEVVLKACLQPWINEAYTITTSIKANLVQLQASQDRIQGSSSRIAIIEQCVEEVQ